MRRYGDDLSGGNAVLSDRRLTQSPLWQSSASLFLDKQLPGAELRWMMNLNWSHVGGECRFPEERPFGSAPRAPMIGSPYPSPFTPPTRRGCAVPRERGDEPSAQSPRRSRGLSRFSLLIKPGRQPSGPGQRPQRRAWRLASFKDRQFEVGGQIIQVEQARDVPLVPMAGPGDSVQ